MKRAVALRLLPAECVATAKSFRSVALHHCKMPKSFENMEL